VGEQPAHLDDEVAVGGVGDVGGGLDSAHDSVVVLLGSFLCNAHRIKKTKLSVVIFDKAGSGNVTYGSLLAGLHVARDHLGQGVLDTEATRH
jgi:hypothetical protein